MKNLFFLALAFTLVTASCTKEYTGNPTNGQQNNQNNDTGGSGGGGGTGGGGTGGGGTGGGSAVGPVPNTFTQKVLIEEFTGEWCGYCPDGALKLEAAVNQHPGKVFGAAIHDGDPYEIPSLNSTFQSTFNVSGYPSGMVNRTPSGSQVCLDRNFWLSFATSQLANNAVCGLAMTSYTTGTDSFYVQVHAGFNQALTGNHYLTVYVLEDGIVSNGQANYYNDGSIDPNSPLVGLGNPIVNWEHDHVVRQVLTAPLGDPIPASKLVPGGEHVVKFGGRYTGIKKDKMSFVAFVNTTGTTSLDHKILNVQKAKLYEIKKWD
ncbi:MAG: Omp28-related outer membrane protein [Chitinophagales bacterium]|nr:Omp28-related outer membrane protein [Chitinophagales bacterium]MDW8392967.1 Omp28-related outer membrane protein [Chitinophagales bacterium]